MREFNWNCAPDWATCVVNRPQSSACYWHRGFNTYGIARVVGMEAFDAVDPFNPSENGYVLMCERPDQWSSEGLPPVGSHVSIIDPRGTLMYGHGEEGEVVAHVETTAVVRMSYGLGCFEARNLAPIKTAEQIAEDERDAGINEMIGHVKDHPGGRHGANHMTQLKIQEEACRDLYLAGYRKNG